MSLTHMQSMTSFLSVFDKGLPPNRPVTHHNGGQTVESGQDKQELVALLSGQSVCSMHLDVSVSKL